MEGGDVATADFPGEARACLRAALRPGLPVLYMQGASGDTSPWDMLGGAGFRDGDLRAREMGEALASETLRLLREAPLHEDAPLRHLREDLQVGVRIPSPDQLERARRIQVEGEERAGRWDYVLAVCGVLRLHDEFSGNPVDSLPIHAVRIGDFALVTNPCELYCQFGLDIKRRSPFAVTAVAQLTGGSSGYCPTIPAILGGGYSGDAIHWSRLEPYAGYRLVDASARLLNVLRE
jgi:hypothetical protein